MHELLPSNRLRIFRQRDIDSEEVAVQTSCLGLLGHNVVDVGQVHTRLLIRVCSEYLRHHGLGNLYESYVFPATVVNALEVTLMLFADIEDVLPIGGGGLLSEDGLHRPLHLLCVRGVVKLSGLKTVLIRGH